MHDLRAALFAHVQTLPAAFFDRNPVGRLMTRILGDVEAIGEVFTAGVVAIGGDIITLAGIVTVMLLLHLRLTLVIFAVLPILVGVAVGLRRPIRRAYRDVRARLAHLNAELQETMSGMTVSQLFGREGARAGELRALSDRYRQAQFRRMGFESAIYAVAEAVGAFVVAALLWWGGGDPRRHPDVRRTRGLHAIHSAVYLPIRDASAKLSVMQAATVAAERVFALLDTPSEVGTAVPPATVAAAKSSSSVRPRRPSSSGTSGSPIPASGMAARNGRDPWPRRRPGVAGSSRFASRRERIAVVGATGAGRRRSHLLTRTYDGSGCGPRGGHRRPRVGPARPPAARRSRAAGRGALRRHCRAKPRSRRARRGRRSRTWRATSHADPFIRALGGAYDAPLLERGANLSHGQRQLLSVARALLYNPPVLVLDEATSSVDPETEHLLQDAVNQLLTGRTSMVIAHRFSTIQRADRVVVLQHGQLVDDGPHAELIRRDGLYRTLWELQFGPDGTANGRAADAAARG